MGMDMNENHFKLKGLRISQAGHLELEKWSGEQLFSCQEIFDDLLSVSVSLF